MLESLSLYHEDITFFNTIGFIGAIILLYLNEEDTFWMINYLLDSTMIRKWIVQDSKFLKKTMYIFQRLIEIHLPTIFQNMAINGVEPGYYAIPWFITLFCSKTNMDISVKIIDLLFIDGYTTIFKVGLAVINMKYDDVIDAGFEKILMELNSHLGDLDKNELFGIYSTIDVTHKDIEKISEEFHRNPKRGYITM